MSIALYDADYVKYKEFIPYSYTLMKYAAYYKKRHEIVKLITDLDRADKYSKLLYNQDTIDDFDRRALNHPNVTFSGLRFDGGVWKPLPPEVEKCAADTFIYPSDTIRQTEKARQREVKLKKSFNIMACTNETPNGDGKSRTVFFHDYNIFASPNWKQRIEESLFFEGRKRLYTYSSKFPQYIPNDEAFLFFETIPIDKYFCTLRADVNKFSPEVMADYFENSTNCLHRQLTFGVNTLENYNTTQLLNEFMDVYKWNFFAIKNDKLFLLYNKGICKNSLLDSFFDRLVEWNNADTRYKISFYNYIYRKGQPLKNTYKNELVKELFKQEKNIQEISKIDIRELIQKGGVWPL